jgi:hypothetical protein
MFDSPSAFDSHACEYHQFYLPKNVTDSVFFVRYSDHISTSEPGINYYSDYGRSDADNNIP